jgi:hypothetical protein
MSWLAVLDLWASARTSVATTAKPLPADPARAASTDALRARRFVWNAIPSITDTISPIRVEATRMSPIAPTADATTRPASSTRPVAFVANWLAWAAPSAEDLAVAEISSIAAEVSSSEAACCSARRASSMDCSVIWPACVVTASQPVAISSTTRVSVASVSFTLAWSSAKSPA